MTRRRVVHALGVLAGLVLLVGAITALLLRHRLVESWALARLESTDPRVRLDAAERLGELRSRSAAQRLVAEIRARGGDGSGSIRELLLAVGEPAIEELSVAISEGELFARLSMVEILGAFGSRARSAIPALVASDDPYLVSAAAQALREIGEIAVPGLLRLLVHERMDARHHAARELGELYPGDATVLANIAGESSPQERERSASAWLLRVTELPADAQRSTSRDRAGASRGSSRSSR